MELDLILRHVSQDESSCSDTRDVGIVAGRIVAVEPHLEAAGKSELNCQDLIVTSGLIDLHVHAAHSLGASSLEPDEIGIKTGVTTIVDAGSTGAILADAFCTYVQPRATTRLLGFINIALDTNYPQGIGDPSNLNLAATLKQLERHPSIFRGIKVMASTTKLGVLGLEAVKVAKKAAELAGLPLMVHIGNAPPLVTDVLDLLDEGDIVTHCFHGKPGGLMDRHGGFIPQAWAALERGVKFDIGHGSASFNRNVFIRAMENGFPFHTISSDLHKKNRKSPVVDLVTTMNKFLALGCTLPQVLEAVTRAPADILGMPDLGGLQVGSVADISILRLHTGSFEYLDSDGNSFTGKESLTALYTVKDGKVVWSA